MHFCFYSQHGVEMSMLSAPRSGGVIYVISTPLDGAEMHLNEAQFKSLIREELWPAATAAADPSRAPGS